MSDRNIDIHITACAVTDTDFQRLADKLYAAVAGEANTIKVAVRATVVRPTEVTFQPDYDGQRPYADALWKVDH